jgi:EpsI family protein
MRASEGMMNLRDRRWWPVGLLAVGVLLTAGGVRSQQSMQLRMPLDEAVPRVIDGWSAHDLEISEAEQRVAGMSSFVMRIYAPEGEAVSAASAFSVYVGFYDRQAQGKTIHSPKNCLPGGGWEPLVASREVIDTRIGPAPVNRYLIGNGPAKALVLYWYQGRGRIAANEYLVKWDLLRDQALHGRSDEALVRVIVPVTASEEEAYEQAVRVAAELAGYVDRALPPRDDTRVAIGM